MSSLWLSSFILLAATLGDWSSSALLGRLYSIGEGVSTDYAGEGKSKEWYDAVETQTRLLSCTPQVTCRNQGSLLLGGWGQCVSRQILCQLLLSNMLHFQVCAFLKLKVFRTTCEHCRERLTHNASPLHMNLVQFH